MTIAPPDTRFSQLGLDFSAYHNDSERINALVERLQTEGLYREDLLYSGFNGIKTWIGVYPDRLMIHAISEAKWRKDAIAFPRLSVPFYYSRKEEDRRGCMPAVGVFNPHMLEHAGATRYLSLPGRAIGEACVAVTYWGNMLRDDQFRESK